MKLQNLSIIFLVIIIPISVVFSAYISTTMKTLNTQVSYDAKLQEATAEAVKAFQINTLNSSQSNLADSKRRDIESAANAFFTALQSKFSMNGYSQQDLQSFVPAVAFTLYDGYYIYGPYRDFESNQVDYGLKPYVYYSCRYVHNSLDVIITYSLDSYISITGKTGPGDSDTINLEGYLLTNVEANDTAVSYRGVNIQPENSLSQTILLDGSARVVNYRKIMGTKYYQSGNTIYTISNGTLSQNSLPTSIPTGRRDNYISGQNTDAQSYYRQAAELKNTILNSQLRNLTIGDAVDEDGNQIFNNATLYPDYVKSEEILNTPIFAELNRRRF